MNLEKDNFNKMQKGDPKAFEYFFKKYSDMLYAYALGFMKNKEVAEDVVQDVYVYFWNHRERIEYMDSIYGYLLRAVKNNCMNLKHREEIKAKYEREMLYVDQEEAFDWSDVDRLREMRNRLLDAIDRLPERCREIFIKSCLQGMRYKDVAKELGISENTVKTQVKLAYTKMQEDIGLKNNDLVVFLILISFIS